ncbi:InlB B-repeat-containing protein [Leifsonia sp. YAF41]|uniref:InlB B-repeat-containing protein n=1 Tax=Leifsonia sp. YAF41 TaxID=3233086 RepID=UPI003F9E5B60
MSRMMSFRPRVSAPQLRRLIALAVVVPLMSSGIVAGSALAATAADMSTTVTTDVELAAAFDAASGAGNTVTLGADIVAGGLTVPAGATVTLSLNGYELTATGAPERAGIAVRVGSTLNVDGPGELTANGGDSASGIGSPVGDNTPAGGAGTIIIRGGTIHANGGRLGAGIGSGGWSEGGTIRITGGTVTAQGGEAAAGIGSGYNRGVGSISISGGSVIALGGTDGAGIGSGVQSSSGTLSISGGNVAAIGGNRAAGLGGGYTSTGLAVSITGGSVVAGGGTGIAIGAGEDNPGDYFGSLSNSGNLQTAPGSTLRIPAGQTFVNSGTFVNGGTLVVNGVLENSGSLSGGVATITGILVNTGTLPSGIAIDVPALTVHFNDGDASHGSVEVYAPTLQTVIDAGVVAERPTRPAYDFVGWFTAPTGGAAWDAATVLSRDTGLFAQWMIRTYTVTFDTRGGNMVDPQQIDHGNLASVPTPPVRVGYVFAGWTADESGSDAWDSTVAVTDDLTLYAKWTVLGLTVSFDSRGGSVVAEAFVAYGNTIAPPSDPTRDGYTFAGWTTDAKGSVAWDLREGVTADLTLYAAWELVAVTPTPTPTPTATAPAGSGLASTGWNGNLAPLLALGLLIAGMTGLVFVRRRRLR